MEGENTGGNPKFSLGSGGLLNRFFAKTGLADPSIPGMATRALFLMGLTWLPLLILSIIRGSAWGQKVDVPFLYDTGVNVRFLISLPLLVMAEAVIGRGLSGVLELFITSRIVQGEDQNKFERLQKKTDGVLGSLVPELLILVITAVVSIFAQAMNVQRDFPVGISSWFDLSAGLKSPAGVWYQAVSHPIYRFLILRWLWRFLVWVWFLRRVSRLRLSLTATHPDHTGGLGFLQFGHLKFGLLVLAISAQFAGLIARKITFEAASIRSFELVILGYILLMVLIFFAPLFVFTPQLIRCKRHGLIAYGGLAKRYTSLFEKKWVKNGGKTDEDLLGSADIQSLADLANSFQGIHQMKPYPFNPFAVVMLLGQAVLPFLPLVFFVYGLNELLLKAVQFIF